MTLSAVLEDADDTVLQHHSVAKFLLTAAIEPAMLLVSGAAGIGKTTLWSSAIERARELGIRVLSTRSSACEAQVAYAALAKLLGEVDTAAWSDLPDPQRLALNHVTLRDNPFRGAIDHRAVATAFLRLVVRLAQESPLLLAIDDLPSLDPLSQNAIAFVARRLTGRVGILATVSDEPGVGDPTSWLQIPNITGLQRITVGPLKIGALHAVLRKQLGRSFPRPIMAHIHQVSGGNPFYAIELAKAVDGSTATADLALPHTLAALVRTKIERFDTDLRETLLAASCVDVPTVELVARATSSDNGRVVCLLERAEKTGLIGIDGHRLRFAHPLLAHGVYSGATSARRRVMHRRLAGIVAEPEQRARHLGLATSTGDPEVVRLLDDAAQTARRRGAPAAAADLLDLALGLGGDTSQRRIRCAGYHLAAGDVRRARDMLEATIAELDAGPERARALSTAASVRLLDDSVDAAADLLAQAIDESGQELALRVPMLIALAVVLASADQLTAAIASADDAVADATQLADPALSSAALGIRVALGVLRGHDVDERLRRETTFQEHGSGHAVASIAFQTSMSRALVHAWTGRLELARTEMRSLAGRCHERGAEHELTYVDHLAVVIELWRADFPAATALVTEAMERAQQLGGDLPLVRALAVRASLAAFEGRVDAARNDAHAALAITKRSGAHAVANSTIATLGFIEVSLSEYHAALATLGPLLAGFGGGDGTELIAASFVPDAVEALVGVGRLAEAEALVRQLESTGARLDRPWMLALGARGRAMLLAARGDVEAACATAMRALTEHQRLPMPFERARTQLLLGQIQCRGRQRDVAANTLREALATFEDLGTPLWADRARAELGRSVIGPRRRTALTPSEQRIAELTADGMTNRDVAAALFISPKTVEANLARVYRKLGIRSRAELGRSMSRDCSRKTS